MSAASPAPGRPATVDVLVAGGGPAGLALGLALATMLTGRASIRVHDPLFARGRADPRAWAIAAEQRRFLAQLGVWPAIEPLAQPVRAMEVGDSALEEVMRFPILRFDEPRAPGDPFAHIVPAGALTEALARAAAAHPGLIVDTAPVRRVPLAEGGAVRRVETADGTVHPARLVVVADGRRSRLRAEAGLPLFGRDYGQSAIVGTLAHPLDHGGVARQHFLPGGPFALLPLRGPDGAGTRSALVWTERRAAAERLLAGPPEALLAALRRRAGGALGALEPVEPLKAWPLVLGLARRFTAERLALLGDAAHAIHPIAGQGANLALRDVAALARAVAEHHRLGLDPGDDAVLRAYERARRFDSVRMAAVTDGLNRLFSNDLAPLRALRSFGLGLVDRLSPLKRRLVAEAAGEA